MTPSDNLQRLVERIEAATGPDREIDALVHFTVNRRWVGRIPCWPPEKVYRPDMETGLYMAIEGKGYMYGDSVPTYTASLDAALLIVPDGMLWMLTNTGIQNRKEPDFTKATALVSNWRDMDTDETQAETPALALCAAALRARITQESRK